MRHSCSFSLSGFKMEMRSILVVLFLAVLADARQYVCPKVNNYLSRDQCKGVRDMCGSHRDCASRDHLCCPTEGECYLSCQIAVPQSTARVQRCQTPIDLAIVLDSSASIGKANWENMKAFAKALVDSFDIAEKKTHVSIMTISTHPKIEIKFNTEPNDVTIKRDIDGLKFRGGRSYINTALKMVASRMFTEQAGMRANVPKVCVVVTDGIADDGMHTPGEVLRASQMAKDKGVEIFALGVSEDMDLMNLIMTASTPDTLFSFRGWRTKLRHYIKKRCSGPSLYA